LWNVGRGQVSPPGGGGENTGPIRQEMNDQGKKGELLEGGEKAYPKRKNENKRLKPGSRWFHNCPRRCLREKKGWKRREGMGVRSALKVDFLIAPGVDEGAGLLDRRAEPAQKGSRQLLNAEQRHGGRGRPVFTCGAENHQNIGKKKACSTNRNVA